ncbi:hypothetical protein BJ944DRAFT_15912 [Cunninghamella echinulata]|nr:hypothetical protein BJ944DRAFT_15912 [Cunninghamella echinulata]
MIIIIIRNSFILIILSISISIILYIIAITFSLSLSPYLVNRPCKRCITLGKTDTCLDIKHKKRGRPKLRHKIDEEESMNNIQVMSGTIQSPIITSTNTTINNNNNNHDHQLIPNNISSSRKISFCHQPIETFKKKSKENNNNTTHSIITPIQLISTSLNNNNNNSNNTPVHNNIYNKGNDNDTADYDHFDNDNDLPIEKKTPTTKITLILSMEVCFARMTEDVTMAWGYYPQELAHRTMYDFIAMEDTDRLSRLHRLILDSIVDVMSNVDNPSQQQQMKKKTNHPSSSSSSSSSYYKKPPPPTERSTSELFHQKSIQELSNIANGSVSFNDTLHIKTRSGHHELYDICMYIGGGLGGDLNIPSTFTKLYIVMVCHKHKKMEKQWPLLKLSQQQQKQKSNSSSSSPFKPIAPFPSSSSIRPPLIKPAPHDLRQVILPAHFTNNSKLNTISVNDYSIVSPKINIAPMSNNNKNLSHNKKLLDQSDMTSLSSPSSSSSSFLLSKTTTITSSPTISLSSSSSTSTSTSVSSSSLITCKPILTQPSSSPTSTIPAINHSNFRFKSSSSTPSSSSQPSYHRDTSSAVVNHPTTQYFLQTSSSNLNVAAASAVKDNQYGINNNPMNPNEVSSSSNNKKKGMSIRSLLC